MITQNNLILLQDMGDNLNLTDIVIFDNEVDMVEVRKMVSGLWQREEWTYDDLLKELDKFGSYCVIPTSVIETINY